MAGIWRTLGVMSLGTVANWQFGVSSRSIWNSSLVMPISTLYASPENSSSDWFCAFQPNREILPSLPFRLGRPLMPRALLVDELALRLARIALSVICSISPAPKTGVGIRKTMLLLRTCLSKSSCRILHPGASACPAITKRAWTPPSRLPSLLNWNRASRIGPSRLMNEGMMLPTNPRSAGTRNKGFTAGLVPPTAG